MYVELPDYYYGNGYMYITTLPCRWFIPEKSYLLFKKIY